MPTVLVWLVNSGEVGGGNVNADAVALRDGPHDGQGLDLHLDDLAGLVVVDGGGIAVIAVSQRQQAVADVVGHAVGVHLADGVGKGGVLHVGADKEVGDQITGQSGVLVHGIGDKGDHVVTVAGGREGVAAAQVAGAVFAVLDLGAAVQEALCRPRPTWDRRDRTCR